MSEPLVLYHADCLDGTTAAYVAQLARPEAELLAVKHGNPPPDVTGRQVYILDFSYPRPILEALHSQAQKLMVLDHHESAQKDLAGLDYCLFDMKRSGATLAWDYFFPEQDRPKLVEYVEDCDFWRFSLPSSRKVMAALMSYPKKIYVWTELHLRMETDLDSVIAEGQAILRYQEGEVSYLIKNNAREVVLAGYSVIAVNTPCLRSEVANKVAENRPFGIAWSQKEDGKFVYSLRRSLTHPAPDAPNLAEIAKLFGGGGHPAASAFMSNQLLF